MMTNKTYSELARRADVPESFMVDYIERAYSRGRDGSPYRHMTSEERERTAATRVSGGPVPRCAANFDHHAACDLKRSHLCGLGDTAVVTGAFMAYNMGSK